MAFLKNQEVTYTPIVGKKENAKIILRKQDFEGGQIDTFTIKGLEFDYLISIKRNGIETEILCLEKDLS